MSLTTPTRGNRYQLPSWPPTEFSVALWNLVFGDIAERLTDREKLEATFESLKAQGIQASLDYIQETVAPQIVKLQKSISLAQEQINQIIIGGKAPDALKFGGELPEYYATAEGLKAVRESLGKYILADQRAVAGGLAPLGSDGKVPLANLPTMTTTTTVGAAVAGANGIVTPDDGDALAGVKSGSSTMFRLTWGNIKAALAAFFDNKYLRLVGGTLFGPLTITTSGGTWAVLDLRAAGEGAQAAIDFSPSGWGGDYLWRIAAHSDHNFDLIYNGSHKLRLTTAGHIWTSGYGMLTDRFADRGARVWHDGGIWEFGVIDPNYQHLTTDAPNPFVLIGLRSSPGTNLIQLRAVQLRNN